MEQSRYHPRPLCGDSVGPSKWSNQVGPPMAHFNMARFHPRVAYYLVGQFFWPTKFCQKMKKSGFKLVVVWVFTPLVYGQ